MNGENSSWNQVIGHHNLFSIMYNNMCLKNLFIILFWWVLNLLRFPGKRKSKLKHRFCLITIEFVLLSANDNVTFLLLNFVWLVFDHAYNTPHVGARCTRNRRTAPRSNNSIPFSSGMLILTRRFSIKHAKYGKSKSWEDVHYADV